MGQRNCLPLCPLSRLALCRSQSTSCRCVVDAEHITKRRKLLLLRPYDTHNFVPAVDSALFSLRFPPAPHHPKNYITGFSKRAEGNTRPGVVRGKRFREWRSLSVALSAGGHVHVGVRDRCRRRRRRGRCRCFGRRRPLGFSKVKRQDNRSIVCVFLCLFFFVVHFRGDYREQDQLLS